MVFRGRERDSYTFVTSVNLSSTSYQSYLVPIDTPAKYIVICRNGFGAAREDVEVDAVFGCQR
jgi:hypothetical protein